MQVAEQVRRLIESGVPGAAGISPAELTGFASDLPAESDAILVVHPSLAAPSVLAGLLRHRARSGFVVADMADVDEFGPAEGVDVPSRPLYLLHGPDRGDELRNWSPDEALGAILARGRTPLTLNEGISWLLQDPDVLAPGACFMTIGSRRRRGSGLDPRTPAIWISRGTGRDGPQRRNAPKVGWCWAGNRHTWLGHASASSRSPGR